MAIIKKTGIRHITAALEQDVDSMWEWVAEGEKVLVHTAQGIDTLWPVWVPIEHGVERLYVSHSMNVWDRQLWDALREYGVAHLGGSIDFPL